MQQNAYLLAKIGADAAENERNFAKNLPRIGSYPTAPLPGPERARRAVGVEAALADGGQGAGGVADLRGWIP